MYVGDKGIVLAGFNGTNPRLYPPSPKYLETARNVGRPEARNEGARNPAIDSWITACKKGPATLTNFEVQAPVTEAFLLGCIAQRLPGEKIHWDTAQMKSTNSEKANTHIDPPYRNGFTV